MADQHPELVISKQAIIEKLEGRAGPQARKLFEKFVRDLSVCGYVSFFVSISFLYASPYYSSR